MKQAVLTAVAILAALFAGAAIQSCGSNEAAEAAKAEAARWQDSSQVRDVRIADLEAEKAAIYATAADSIAGARATADESERAVRAAQSRNASLVAELERMVPDTGRAVLADHLTEDSIIVAGKDSVIAAREIEIRQKDRQLAIDERLLVAKDLTIASRDSTITAQSRAIDALEHAGFRLFGIRLDCVAGAGAAGGRGFGAGVAVACGVPLGG